MPAWGLVVGSAPCAADGAGQRPPPFAHSRNTRLLCWPLHCTPLLCWPLHCIAALHCAPPARWVLSWRQRQRWQGLRGPSLTGRSSSAPTRPAALPSTDRRQRRSGGSPGKAARGDSGAAGGGRGRRRGARVGGGDGAAGGCRLLHARRDGKGENLTKPLHYPTQLATLAHGQQEGRGAGVRVEKARRPLSVLGPPPPPPPCCIS